MSADSSSARFTCAMALQLAAPHTWPASILPVLVACAAAAQSNRPVSLLMAGALLAACVLMQAAVNTLNDYYDFEKGTDSAQDNVEASDAVLVHNKVDPRHARNLAIGYLAAAFATGSYVVAHAGWIPLALAAVGAAVVVLYSAGKTPLSYLPVGELSSGIVMGGLIPLACYQALSGSFDLRALAWSLPTMIGVGLIMLTNNTCDIERDCEAGRRTLPVLIGRERARSLYHLLLYLWLVLIVVVLAWFFTKGLLIAPFMLLASYPLVKALLANPLTPQARIGAMAQVCGVNIALGAFYAAAILASGVALSA